MGKVIDVDVENEQIILAALINDPEILKGYALKIKPGRFVAPKHQALMGALKEIVVSGGEYAPDTAIQLSGSAVSLKYLIDLEENFEAIPAANLELHLQRLDASRIKAEAAEAFSEIYDAMEDPHTSLPDLNTLIGDFQREIKTGISPVDEDLQGEKFLKQWVKDLDQLRDNRQEIFKPLYFSALDQILFEGLKPGNLTVVAARPGMGKALALDTKIPTPGGWTIMGDVKPGDTLFGSDGSEVNVIGISDIMDNHSCYRVSFSDGTSVVADAEHLWTVHSRSERKYGRDPSVRTTSEIRDTLRVGADHRLNYSIPETRPLKLPDIDLEVPPYVLGTWLGDGETLGGRIYTPDVEVLDRIKEDGFKISKGADPYGWGVYGLKILLREIGVLGNKHIPVKYLRSSESQRRQLLEGLLDSDGYLENGDRTARFDVTCKRLFDGVVELVRSLGYRVGIGSRRVKGRSEETSICYRLWFTPGENVFSLSRKSIKPCPSSGLNRRFITSAERVDSVPVKCLKVDHDDQLFLVGDGFIPTHNTTFCSNLILRQVLKGKSVLAVPVESGRSAIFEQMLCARTRIPSAKLIKTPHKITKEERLKLIRVGRKLLSGKNLRFNDMMSSIDELEAELESHPWEVAVLDLFEYLIPGRKESDVLTDALRRIRKMGRKYGTHMIVVHQIRRIERRRNPRPQISELKNSGGYEEVADLILLLHRDRYYGKDEEEDILEVNVAKQRRGPMEVNIGFEFHPEICRVGNHTEDFKQASDLESILKEINGSEEE